MNLWMRQSGISLGQPKRATISSISHCYLKILRRSFHSKHEAITFLISLIKHKCQDNDAKQGQSQYIMQQTFH
ncbi:CLUMA_CG018419, isoform A [Clunio marinus]|uniref:CLUMA_CG018419, isoform A n=1 Tax=Clunio marinus TaxID=568069 RepID=A0A1J1IXT4_9DIPT|nr:CLUMA_CG018419, isoform A [Clunio marinus]